MNIVRNTIAFGCMLLAFSSVGFTQQSSCPPVEHAETFSFTYTKHAWDFPYNDFLDNDLERLKEAEEERRRCHEKADRAKEEGEQQVQQCNSAAEQLRQAAENKKNELNELLQSSGATTEQLLEELVHLEREYEQLERAASLKEEECARLLGEITIAHQDACSKENRKFGKSCEEIQKELESKANMYGFPEARDALNKETQPLEDFLQRYLNFGGKRKLGLQCKLREGSMRVSTDEYLKKTGGEMVGACYVGNVLEHHIDKHASGLFDCPCDSAREQQPEPPSEPSPGGSSGSENPGNGGGTDPTVPGVISEPAPVANDPGLQCTNPCETVIDCYGPNGGPANGPGGTRYACVDYCCESSKVTEFDYRPKEER